MGSGGHDRNLAIRLEAPQSGGGRRHASAHLLGHRAKYLQRSNAARDQRGPPTQRGLLGDEPTILLQYVWRVGRGRLRRSRYLGRHFSTSYFNARRLTRLENLVT